MRHLLSFTAYAAHRGVSAAAVSQAVSAGRITTVQDEGGRRLIDPEVADVQWKKNTDLKQSERANAGKRGGNLPDAGTPQSEKYWEIRTRREAAEMQMAELRAAELAASLVSAERVRAAAMRMSRMLRDSLLAIPAKIAPTLATETDPHQVEQRLTAALRRALDDIASMTANDLERLAD